MQAIRRLAALAAVCALAVPSSAFAQSAGDNQYQDPLGGSQGSSGASQGSGSGSSSTTGSSSSGSSSSGQATGSAGSASGSASASASGRQLPRTGGEPFTIALLGGGLLLAGVGLRLRVRRPLG